MILFIKCYYLSWLWYKNNHEIRIKNQDMKFLILYGLPLKITDYSTALPSHQSRLNKAGRLILLSPYVSDNIRGKLYFVSSLIEREKEFGEWYTCQINQNILASVLPSNLYFLNKWDKNAICYSIFLTNYITKYLMSSSLVQVWSLCVLEYEILRVKGRAWVFIKNYEII